MQRKLRDYFAAGVKLVWYIDPPTRSAKSYTAEDRFVTVDEDGRFPAGMYCPASSCR